MPTLGENMVSDGRAVDSIGMPSRQRSARSLSFTALAVSVGLLTAGCGTKTRTVTETQGQTGASTTLTRHPGRAHQEMAQGPADEFNNSGMAAVIGHTVTNHSYEVTCRIPPSSEQPSSVADGGWYVLEQGGVVAANTFDNPPLSADNPYDPAVPVC